MLWAGAKPAFSLLRKRSHLSLFDWFQDGRWIGFLGDLFAQHQWYLTNGSCTISWRWECTKAYPGHSPFLLPSWASNAHNEASEHPCVSSWVTNCAHYMYWWANAYFVAGASQALLEVSCFLSPLTYVMPCNVLPAAYFGTVLLSDPNEVCTCLMLPPVLL